MAKIHLYSSVFVAHLAGLILTISNTWSSPMSVKFNGTDDNPLGRRISAIENGLLTSLLILGGMSGSIIFGLISSKFGRKTILLSLGVVNFFVFLVMLLAKRIWLLYICRFTLGFTGGGAGIIVYFYVTELAETNNRGFLFASGGLFCTTGSLLPYFLGPFISYFYFHLIPLILSFIFIVLFYFIALESPFYLIKHDKEKAREVLRKIRNPEEIEENLKMIEKNVDKTDKGTIFDILKSSGLKKAFFSVCGLSIFQLLTGSLMITHFTQTIFEIAKGNSEGGIDPKLCPIIIGITNFLTTFITPLVADKFPRKTLLIFFHISASLIQIPFGLYFILKDNGTDVNKFSLVPLICLILFIIVMHIGGGPIFSMYSNEIFPFEVKGIAVSMSNILNSILGFFIVLFFNLVIELIGMGYLYWIFSFCGFLAPIFITFFMVETRGKSLQEIQDILNNKKKNSNGIKC